MYETDDETGICGCGAETDYFGPDPYSSELCDCARRPYNDGSNDCDCWEEEWICEDCYSRSVADI